jgi:hypothetical protein
VFSNQKTDTENKILGEEEEKERERKRKKEKERERKRKKEKEIQMIERTNEREK